MCTYYIPPIMMIKPPTVAAVIANRAVFNTTELLENILLHFSNKKLYQLRSISHHWQTTIETSPSLMRKLCPPATQDLTAWQISYHNGRLHQVLPLDSPPPQSLPTTTATIPCMQPNGPNTFTVLTTTLHPLLRLKKPLRQLLRTHSRGMPCSLDLRNPHPQLEDLYTRLISQDLPLRNFVSDPPAQIARVTLTWSARGPKGQNGVGTMERIVRSETGSGLTIGDLLKGLFLMKGECKYEEDALSLGHGFGGDGGDDDVREKGRKKNKKKMTLARKIEGLKKRGFTGFEAQFDGLKFWLYGVVVPSEEEREVVEEGTGRLCAAGWVVQGGGPWLQ